MVLNMIKGNKVVLCCAGNWCRWFKIIGRRSEHRLADAFPNRTHSECFDAFCAAKVWSSGARVQKKGGEAWGSENEAWWIIYEFYTVDDQCVLSPVSVPNMANRLGSCVDGIN